MKRKKLWKLCKGELLARVEVDAWKGKKRAWSVRIVNNGKKTVNNGKPDSKNRRETGNVVAKNGWKESKILIKEFPKY